MVSLQGLVISLALLGGGGGGNEIVLLDFTADGCKPCQMMAPVVQRLERQGFPVKRINVDQQPQLAQQYRIDAVPCFVLLQNGKEIERVKGAASYDLLVRLFEKQGYAAADEPTVRAQSPDDGGPENQWQRPSQSRTEPPATVENTIQQRALASSVRLRIEEPNGQAFGTGTIIDVRDDEALVVTCGHLFRDSQGKAPITVELLAPGAAGPVSGELITYEAEDHDIALVAFRPGVPVLVAPVASSVQGIVAGAPVFSVGCDHGGEPTVIDSQIAGIDKYVGRRKYSHNIEVAGLPVDGRSGGGLFDAQGRLIGLCNAADPADNEGIFAGLKTIHAHLDGIQLSAIYQSPRQGTLVSQPNVTSEPDSSFKQPDRGAPNENQQPLPNLLSALESGTEVICIVRSPNGKDEVLVLDKDSREILARYVQDRVVPAEIATRPDDSPTVRAQNGRY